MPHRASRVPAVAVALWVVAAAVPARAEAPRAADDEHQWWTARYLVDYGLIAAGGVGALIGDSITPRSDPLIGPRYDPDDPAAIFGSQVVDEPYLDKGTESVPAAAAVAGVGGNLLGLAALEALEWSYGDGSAQQLHDTFVGALEATAITGGLTTLTKSFTGRLRPDFADRARRYHCSTTVEPPAGCDGYVGEPLADDPEAAAELLEDGRRSFFSGHSSHAFSALTYSSLVIGGRYVWGDAATTTTRVAGIAAQSALLGLAAYTSGSRIADGRHHPTDVITGALVGALIANASYWRRFDTRGRLRHGARGEPGARVQLQPLTNGTGLSLTIRF